MSEKQNRDFRAQMERERTAISAAQLTLTQMRLGGSNTEGWWLEGMVMNRSTYQLQSLTLTVFQRSCAVSADERSCVTTGEDDIIFYVNVPSGQARRLRSSVQFENTPEVQAGWGWNYSVKEIRANLNPSI